MAELQLQGLRRTYANGVTAVDGIDLTVHDGEFMVLVGPSGCGKSTTLRMIAGLEDMSAGRMLIGGADVTDVPPAERGVAMVFQSYALYPHMTVAENMGFALKIAGRPRREIDDAVRRAAASLQLEPLLDRKPRALSGGQRQRVAIGRAIVREPKVFLFDEPLSNLDASLRTQMRLEMARLHERLGATIVYVTHDQVEAMTLATRVAVMRGGRIQQVGTPGEVYARPANMFVAGFLGSPSMNFIEGETSAGGAAVLGVRPEHLALHPADGARSEGEIALVEAMGAHEVVWLDMHGHRLAAIAPATGAHRIGDRVGVQIALDRASVFDPVSQERIELHAGAFHHHPR